jgi:hypothetical protein
MEISSREESQKPHPCWTAQGWSTREGKNKIEGNVKNAGKLPALRREGGAENQAGLKGRPAPTRRDGGEIMQNRIGWVVALAIFGLAAGLRAQEPAEKTTQGGENPFATPELRKYWNPLVGEGAVYEVTGADGTKRTEEFDILSAETLEGKKAYWLEVSIAFPKAAGKVYEKSLVIPAEFRARKVIAQLPGMAAMEMPASGSMVVPKDDPNSKATKAASETITVPGGSFLCEHYQNADGSEEWVSDKVVPMKVVKSVGPTKETRVLMKTTSQVKDAIKGPAKAYDPDAIKKFMEGASSQ